MSFIDEALERHNHYRRLHGVDELTLSNALSEFAQEWADSLALEENFQHRDQHLYGENLHYKHSSNPNFDVAGASVVDSWYNEIEKYKFGKEPKNLQAIGHFTQVVWANTLQVGIAKAKSKNNRIYVVANYTPPGNYIGQFTANVPPPHERND